MFDTSLSRKADALEQMANARDAELANYGEATLQSDRWREEARELRIQSIALANESNDRDHALANPED